MRSLSLVNDRGLKRILDIMEQCSERVDVKLMSIVLYGARAKGDNTSQSVYEFLILSNNETSLDKFILFNETVKLELLREKYLNVNVLTYTPEIFEEILYKDEMVGTFLYMICRENIILYDRYGTFMSIRERMSNNKMKSEEMFLRQCIEFSKKIGSEKWERKFDKTLMHYKYRNNRRKL
ncbi:nucleotidyltransferase domain-containing protein [Acetivibrio mesophilus]|uniref:Nucleotidyltransferase domain-containing protein n=1 Tax=Acetivibrio mesophilus TaxID=2487273 RepID=A0A4Q0I7E5_9FIRM|nr:nucleotidyltransferase domain-containing protein [Acetivibrio mesophilus]ODM25120.1 nucleotidyltransferase [Clostridium sp. Bc-iso-3]RXE59877.1 nucleotidyltransferase domain-containing protein [Acetivibrio mesophilus]HHV29652.1 nucleotidyltransferase domain-containing protein [Clostridium sp.]